MTIWYLNMNYLPERELQTATGGRMFLVFIIHAVAEPRNSGISAESREIHKKTRNNAKFVKNPTKYMSVQHI